MNNKVKLAIAVAVGIVGGGLIGTLGGGESTKQLGSASLASGMEFPEWTRDGSAFRCKAVSYTHLTLPTNREV